MSTTATFLFDAPADELTFHNDLIRDHIETLMADILLEEKKLSELRGRLGETEFLTRAHEAFLETGTASDEFLHVFNQLCVAEEALNEKLLYVFGHPIKRPGETTDATHEALGDLRDFIEDKYMLAIKERQQYQHHLLGVIGTFPTHQQDFREFLVELKPTTPFPTLGDFSLGYEQLQAEVDRIECDVDQIDFKDTSIMDDLGTSTDADLDFSEYLDSKSDTRENEIAYYRDCGLAELDDQPAVDNFYFSSQGFSWVSDPYQQRSTFSETVNDLRESFRETLKNLRSRIRPSVQRSTPDFNMGQSGKTCSRIDLRAVGVAVAAVGVLGAVGVVKHNDNADDFVTTSKTSQNRPDQKSITSTTTTTTTTTIPTVPVPEPDTLHPAAEIHVPQAEIGLPFVLEVPQGSSSRTSSSRRTTPRRNRPSTPTTAAPVVEPTIPSTTVLEPTVPSTTVPEPTIAPTTVPEPTVPSTTVPEPTVPPTTGPPAPTTTAPEPDLEQNRAQATALVRTGGGPASTLGVLEFVLAR